MDVMRCFWSSNLLAHRTIGGEIRQVVVDRVIDEAGGCSRGDGARRISRVDVIDLVRILLGGGAGAVFSRRMVDTG